MQRQTLAAFIFFPISFVADHRVADAGEVDADLVFPAGQQLDFQQRKVFGLFQYFVGGVRQFSLARIGGVVDGVRLVFRQVGGDGVGGLLTVAMDDSEIFLLGVLPLIL